VTASAGAQLGLWPDSGTTGMAWQVRTSARARRLSARVFPGGRVEIVVPPGTRPASVQHFVTRHRSWIDRKVAEHRALGADDGEALPEAIHLRATGERWQLRCVDAPGAPRLLADTGCLLLRGELSRTALARHALQRWLLRAAHQILVPRLAATAADCGLAYSRAQVRRQRTRWGSCSRRGTISLNACLVFQSPEVLHYLLVHELAHTRHMDHSPRFWALVAALEPDWRALDRELGRGWHHVPAWVLR
jgi:predicted metal-dependent hydrolase